MRWLVASIESSCALGSWSSTWLQCTVTASPGFHDRTAEPTRSTTPAASLPTTWNGWAGRAPPPGGTAPDDVERRVVPRPPHALAPEPLEEPERRHGFEDRRPHRVE